MLALLRREAFKKAATSCGTLTQKRNVGNLPVKSNKYIEEFGARRETIEKEFEWDGPTLRRIAVWGLLVPYGVYQMMLFEFDKTDAFGGKPKRDMWGSPSAKHQS
ncbi:hypothetical protein PSENEW3n2_00003906 [Picochlorum sp. SENEW3]|nr:hypothetical protein M9435_002460 [Picochlorum sp. BPE23]WPT12248.1 hypothetical protein PSENEW3n2_00003906 [Picochlorum sp. SENEW3]WPT18606.1 hypothetical protein PSENEW3_00003906 [Picochlorum sp. SENEW3]